MLLLTNSAGSQVGGASQHCLHHIVRTTLYRDGMSSSSLLRSGIEMTLDDLGTPLNQTTFVVVDLETTGGAPGDAGITEIGAVMARGGQVLGTFQTLVNPGTPIPPFVSVLTGITNAMVASAPTLAPAVLSFFEWAGLAAQQPPADLVLVAHNAPYDISFLKAAASKTSHPWPHVRVLDTARLARAVYSRDEVRNCKLGTLAAFIGAQTTPTHRALDDAKATVDVLHHIIGRVGSLGITSVEELSSLSTRVSQAQLKKRTMADDLPNKPGVYIFRDHNHEPLYVGVSRAIKTRVRNYFTASEQRSRMAEMIAVATSVTPIVCATDLEARVREIRLIAEHRPRYNKRSKDPKRGVWLGLKDGAAVAVRTPHTHPFACGPFRGRDDLESAGQVLMLAPQDAQSALEGQRQAIDAVVDAAMTKISRLAGNEHFEQAAVWRDRLVTLLRGIDRAQRLRLLGQIEQVVAASPTPDHGWDIHVIRHGRLCGAATVKPGVDPKPTIEATIATAEVVADHTSLLPAALLEEAQLIHTWLQQDGVRLVHSTSGLAMPLGGAARHLKKLEQSMGVPAIEGAAVFASPRLAPMSARPAVFHASA